MNIQAQLVFNLEETQKQYKDNVDEHWKEQSSFKVRNQVWFQRQTSRQHYLFNFLHNGPFTIVKKLNDVDFEFTLLDSMNIHLLIHVPY
jgi:hypothetical protein